MANMLAILQNDRWLSAWWVVVNLTLTRARNTIRYQFTSIMVWGTVFTNDCYNRLVGSITKIWQPFTTSNIVHTRRQLLGVSVSGYIYISEECALCTIMWYEYEVLYSPMIVALASDALCTIMWYEVLYSPMIVALGLLDPLPRSDMLLPPLSSFLTTLLVFVQKNQYFHTSININTYTWTYTL